MVPRPHSIFHYFFWNFFFGSTTSLYFPLLFREPLFWFRDLIIFSTTFERTSFLVPQPYYIFHYFLRDLIFGSTTFPVQFSLSLCSLLSLPIAKLLTLRLVHFHLILLKYTVEFCVKIQGKKIMYQVYLHVLSLEEKTFNVVDQNSQKINEDNIKTKEQQQKPSVLKPCM